MLYGNYWYIIIKNFPQKFSSCISSTTIYVQRCQIPAAQSSTREQSPRKNGPKKGPLKKLLEKSRPKKRSLDERSLEKRFPGKKSPKKKSPKIRSLLDKWFRIKKVPEKTFSALREISKVKTTIWGLLNINSFYNDINSRYHNFIFLKCCSN